MMRAGLCAVALAFAAMPARAADPKAVDLAPLRDAVETAAKRGENVGDIRSALDALEKVAPTAAAGRVPRELQAVRDAVDAAARKGENVERIAQELAKVETAVAGRVLAPVRPEPKPEPRPQPRPEPNPFDFLPLQPNGNIVGGGIDVATFNKAMDLRRRAVELMLKDPNDPNAIKEAQKLQAEAAQLLMKAALGGPGGGIAIGGIGGMPAFPDPLARVPDRARLGIRLERVAPLAAEQLGLAPNTGIAVTLVAPNSAAEKAGLKVHDIILEFGGKAVTDDTDEFVRRVNAVKGGEKVDVVLLRKGKRVEVKGVELAAAAVPNAARPADPANALIAPGDPVPKAAPQAQADPAPKPLPLQP